jgi:hypothetical protein
MTVSRDDVPLDDLVEQERDLEERPDPEPGDELPDPPVDRWRTDADEGDLVEQSMAVNDDSDDYPRGEDEE